MACFNLKCFIVIVIDLLFEKWFAASKELVVPLPKKGPHGQISPSKLIVAFIYVYRLIKLTLKTLIILYLYIHFIYYIFIIP